MAAEQVKTWHKRRVWDRGSRPSPTGETLARRMRSCNVANRKPTRDGGHGHGAKHAGRRLQAHDRADRCPGAGPIQPRGHIEGQKRKHTTPGNGLPALRRGDLDRTTDVKLGEDLEPPLLLRGAPCRDGGGWATREWRAARRRQVSQRWAGASGSPHRSDSATACPQRT